jgi:hypothetical protein
VWHDFFARERELVDVDLSQGRQHFWRTVIACAAAVGPEPTMLAPYDMIGVGVGLAAHGLPNSDLDEFQVTRKTGLSGGGGTAYLGTIEGVHVFSASVKHGTASMFSGVSLRRIRYGIVAGEQDVADFEFEDAANPAESWVRLKFAQTTEWDNSTIVEFKFDPDLLAEHGRKHPLKAK